MLHFDLRANASMIDFLHSKFESAPNIRFMEHRRAVGWGLLSSDVLPAPPPALSEAEAAGDGPPLIRSGFYASGYQVRARLRVARPNPKGSGQGSWPQPYPQP